MTGVLHAVVWWVGLASIVFSAGLVGVTLFVVVREDCRERRDARRLDELLSGAPAAQRRVAGR